jgi:hypothetical protein
VSNSAHLTKARQSAERDPKKKGRSRVALGKELLPTANAGSHWARIMRTIYDGVVSHCGGADDISDLKRLRARRVAFLEAEMITIEDQVARARETGGEVNPTLLQLYATLDNNQRRDCEVLGWERSAIDITPSLSQRIAEIRAEAAAKAAAEATDIEEVD